MKSIRGFALRLRAAFAVAQTIAACIAGMLVMSAQPEGRGGQQPQEQNQPQEQSDPQTFRFRSGVELINVTATVTDRSGRFVPGLRKEDFRVYQDDELQPVTHFNSERVPVSLGIVLDTSGSMTGEKMAAARDALNRFLSQLLDVDDEVFLYRFDASPVLIEGWTTDKRAVGQALARLQPRGGTAMYDAVAEAVPLAQMGRHRKKALLIISDGNDTSSHTNVPSLKRMIRETEVLVYAIGIDSQIGSAPWPIRFSQGVFGLQRPRRPPRVPVPFPFPFPGGGRRPPPTAPPTFPPAPRGGNTPGSRGGDEGVNVAALRDLTDDSGGRTEIVRSARDLDPATAGIADELSKQYYLGYALTGVKDGRWHTIRVEVRNPGYIVRARRGFVATP
jgi:Ca-activated chloride channel homolog